MKNEILRILKEEIEKQSEVINTLKELYTGRDNAESNLEFVDSILKRLQDEDKSFNTLKFVSIRKDEFDTVIDESRDEIRVIFDNPVCSYEGLCYLINGINEGVELTLEQEQVDAINKFIDATLEKEKEFKDSIIGYNEQINAYEVKDINELETLRNRYEDLLDEVENNSYINDIDLIIKAMEHSDMSQDLVFDLLTYILRFNTETYVRKLNGDDRPVVIEDKNISTGFISTGFVGTAKDPKKHKEEKVEETVEEKLDLTQPIDFSNLKYNGEFDDEDDSFELDLPEAEDDNIESFSSDLDLPLVEQDDIEVDLPEAEDDLGLPEAEEEKVEETKVEEEYNDLDLPLAEIDDDFKDIEASDLEEETKEESEEKVEEKVEEEKTEEKKDDSEEIENQFKELSKSIFDELQLVPEPVVETPVVEAPVVDAPIVETNVEVLEPTTEIKEEPKVTFEESSVEVLPTVEEKVETPAEPVVPASEPVVPVAAEIKVPEPVVEEHKEEAPVPVNPAPVATITWEDATSLLDQFKIKYDDINDEMKALLLSGNMDSMNKLLSRIRDLGFLNIFEKKVNVLVPILVYSSLEIFDSVYDIVGKNLSVDAVDKDTTMKILLTTMPSVLVRSETGSYDTFIKNINTFAGWGIDLINLFDFNKEIFVATNDKLINNYNIVKPYGIKVDDKNAKYLLLLPNIGTRLDYFVESSYKNTIKGNKGEIFDGIEFINMYPQKLNCVEALTIKRLRYASLNQRKIFGAKPKSLTGEITNLKVDVLNMGEEYLRTFFDNEFDTIDPSLVKQYEKICDTDKTVDMTEDETLSTLAPYKKGIRYEINGILVSVNKVIRNYKLLTENGIDKHNALLFALCHNLVITKEEYNNLKGIIK